MWLAASSTFILEGCKKSSTTESASPSTTPSQTQNPGGDTNAIQVRYQAEAQNLRKDTQFSISVTSGANSASMAADLTALLALSQASEEDIKIVYQITEVRDLQLTGGFKPEDPKVNLKELLSQLTGSLVISPTGEPDAEKSEALPENQTKSEDKQKAELRQWVGGFLSFPELPEVQLVVGKAVTHEKEDEFPLPDGRKVPIEEESTYTLVNIDTSQGARIAEIKLETEGTGALEVQQNMISVAYSSQGMLRFNLDEQIPVSVELEESQTIAVGSEGGAEFAVKVNSTFKPAT